jgi:hypothetical protein
MDVSHAFYIGYELAKAATALTLGKGYTQDQELRWGIINHETHEIHEKKQKSNYQGQSCR